MSNDQSLQAQLRDAIARGDKDAVAALMRQGGVTGLLQTLRAVQSTAVQQSMQASAKSSVHVPPTVHAALKQGNLIDAVKRLREANPGMSLKAARDHAQGLAATLPKRHVDRAASTFASDRERTPTVVMGDKPGSLRWMLVVIAFAILAWWWFVA